MIWLGRIIFPSISSIYFIQYIIVFAAGLTQFPLGDRLNLILFHLNLYNLLATLILNATNVRPDSNFQ